jgi:hypothetical protein
LAELVQHVAAQDALAAAELNGTHPTATSLMGADDLPDALRGWAVDAAQVQYLRHPNGQPIEIGRGATAHVLKAMYRGEVVVSSVRGQLGFRGTEAAGGCLVDAWLIPSAFCIAFCMPAAC